MKYLILFFLLFSMAAFGQNTRYEYYFDNNLQPALKSNFVFHGVGQQVEGLLELRLFDAEDQRLILIEHFTDTTLKLNEGLFASFYEKGTKEWEGNYVQGLMDGVWKHWTPEGNIKDSIVYKNGKEEWETKFFYTFDNTLEGWQSEDIAGSKHINYFDKDGKEQTINTLSDFDKVFTKTEIEATFPGGPLAWEHYISKVMISHFDRFKDSDYGTCIIKFIVDTSGAVSNVEAQTMRGSSLAKVAIDAIVHGPKWIPAMQNGRRVRAYRLQPFTLLKPD
jgi:hypothetical protein